VHLLSQPSHGSRLCRGLTQDITGPKSKQYQEQDAYVPNGIPQLGLKNKFGVFIITEI